MIQGSIPHKTFNFPSGEMHVVLNFSDDVYGEKVDVICGDPRAEFGSAEFKGTAELLWETFGGRINSKGYRELDSHIGMIYGDSITLERANDISWRLKHKGFSTTNMVYGIGSFTYQYVTRDTFGMAIKSTAGYIDGKEVHVFKDPKTDNGMKKSAKGYLVVECNEWGDLVLVDGLTKAESSYGGLLKTVFRNGAMDVVDLKSIRDRIDYSVKVMADKGT